MCEPKEEREEREERVEYHSSAVISGYQKLLKLDIKDGCYHFEKIHLITRMMLLGDLLKSLENPEHTDEEKEWAWRMMATLAEYNQATTDARKQSFLECLGLKDIPMEEIILLG